MHETREQKEFWVYAEGRVTKAMGHRCTPGNPDMWWFPAVRFSINEKRCHATKRAAVNEGIEDLSRRISGLETARAKLIAELSA